MQAGGYSPEQSFISNPPNGSLAEVKVRLPSLNSLQKPGAPEPIMCRCKVTCIHSPFPPPCLGFGCALINIERLTGVYPAQIIMSADNGQVRTNTVLSHGLWQVMEGWLSSNESSCLTAWRFCLGVSREG